MPLNTKRPWHVTIAFFLCMIVLNSVRGEQLSQYLYDETNSLTMREKETLELKLSEFDIVTSTQVVVVILAGLEEEAIESASLRIAEENGIGRKERNNGVLLLIVKHDRKMRIEVGYGLEGVLTDAVCGQIIRREIAPRLREGRFFDGISAGVDAIFLATRNEYTAGKSDRRSQGVNWLPIILAVVLFVYFSRNRRNRFMGGLMPTVFFPHGGLRQRSPGWGGGRFSGGGGSFGGGGASGSW